ncbi:hypothetical protein BDD12DRAFT_828423 [Trichophaea hybrida]|nr:hypothetical protein BDD12DRAFT_828423 [Trichophaea hybrida]
MICPLHLHWMICLLITVLKTVVRLPLLILLLIVLFRLSCLLLVVIAIHPPPLPSPSRRGLRYRWLLLSHPFPRSTWFRLSPERWSGERVSFDRSHGRAGAIGLQRQ